MVSSIKGKITIAMDNKTIDEEKQLSLLYMGIGSFSHVNECKTKNKFTLFTFVKGLGITTTFISMD
jgi:hypothetical protein